MDNPQGYRVYVSCECNKRLYIGYTSKPSTSSYLGSYTDKTFQPTHKFDLFFSDCVWSARFMEFSFQKAWQVDTNKKFANRIVSSLTHHTSKDLATKLWQNPEFKKFNSRRIKEGLNKECVKKKISNASKRCWQSSDYRETILNHIEEMSKNPEINKIRSEASTKMWTVEGYRENWKEKIKDVWDDEEKRLKASNTTKKLWQDPSFVEKCLDNRKPLTQEDLDKRSKITKDLWKCEEYSSKVSKGVIKAQQKPSYKLKQRLSTLNKSMDKLIAYIDKDIPLKQGGLVRTYGIDNKQDAYDVLQRLFRKEVELKSRLETLETQK